MVLLGQEEPRFWPVFRASPEAQGGAPDPLDRWSRRVIDEWAAEIRAQALYPFGGPPHRPFLRWALRTGRISSSPVGLLVHDQAGLFVSFRGALALPCAVGFAPPAAAPCETCPDQPCRTACPVDALGHGPYDVDACKGHILGPDSAECMTRGCAVRRACPVSRGFGRVEAQSAFHMQSFTGEPRCD